MSTARFIRELPPDPLPPGHGRIHIQCMTACDCGCGAPDRVLVTVGRSTISLDRPAQIDVMIATLREGRKQLWGEP